MKNEVEIKRLLELSGDFDELDRVVMTFVGHRRTKDGFAKTGLPKPAKSAISLPHHLKCAARAKPTPPNNILIYIRLNTWRRA